jgi:phage terminase large subunit GpA-like protein
MVLACASQVGKTETVLDVIGHRLDISPVPILILGPTKSFLTDQLEPRIVDLLKVKPLAAKMGPAKSQKKTLKKVSGVSLRMATARSSAGIKSDSFGLCTTDEADEIVSSAQGMGNPLAHVDDRGAAYPDFVHLITSTPSRGSVEVEIDPVSGLHFWKVGDPTEIQSTIWRLWQQGTRYHWAWPCPECSEYFIPRFNCLVWDKPKDDHGRNLDSTPDIAARTAALCCPNCGSLISDKHRFDMNARGVFVAPGQSVDPDGTVIGAPPESRILSWWVSGLASPFKSWGDQAARYVESVRSRDPEDIKVAKNNGFGELFSPQVGDVADWQTVALLKRPNPRGSVPLEARYLTAAVDVQKNRLVYVVRAWGPRQTSWLVDHGSLYGETEHDLVWTDLDELLAARYDGLPIRRAFVDSGFRPGEPAKVPVNKVYEFCRRNKGQVYPTKGYKARSVPLSVTRADVNEKGKFAKYGLELVHLDASYFKSWVHTRLAWPAEMPGQWLLHESVDDEYCRQIVSEARVVHADGDFEWVVKRKPNDFLDAEAMAYAAAYMLGVFRMADNSPLPERYDPDEHANAGAAPKQTLADLLASIGGDDEI